MKIKIKIVIEDKKKGKIEVPMAVEEMRNVYNSSFDNLDSSYLHKKLQYIIHDVIDEGKMYNEELKLKKKRSYMVKKPKWKK